LSIESCGQCPPCKLGSSAITEHLERIELGGGTTGDLDAIGGWLARVTDDNRCFLAVEEQQLVTSVLRAFESEFHEHLASGRCPRPRRLAIPKLLDLHDGVAIYDERFWHKRPDWTYDRSGTDAAQ
jgi:NADH-quinone oxidoreductase subunit F